MLPGGRKPGSPARYSPHEAGTGRDFAIIRPARKTSGDFGEVPGNEIWHPGTHFAPCRLQINLVRIRPSLQRVVGHVKSRSLLLRH